MTDDERRTIIREGLCLLAGKYHGTKAEILLAAIAYQESNFLHRRQIKGPARGLWQFEQGGGVWGVMNHRSSSAAAREVCAFRGVFFETKEVYNTLEHDDLLACAFARLLLWTDHRPLPDTEQEAWDYYIRNWRPGKPHPNRWADCWSRAQKLFE